jgi:F-type H+-transporting ATPase subunit delta
LAGNIADVYAESLFELADEAGVLSETAKELTEIAVVMEGFPELNRLLTLPTLTAAEKQDIISKVFGGRISELSEHFLSVLAAKRRVPYYGKIIAEFHNRYNRSQGLQDVSVSSCVPLTDEQKVTLTEKLTEKYKKQIKLHCKIDPSLVGGIVIETNGKTIDGSVKTKLDELRQLLAATTA